jgi:CheY-like chemotaxis protein
MEKPRLLLAEDYGYLRRDYAGQLRRVGFRVSCVKDGLEFSEVIRKRRFDLIVSDSDLPSLNGDEVCSLALKEGLVGIDVLIIGMSDCEDRQKYWRGVVNVGCFYNKANLTDGRMGEKVLNCWNNFLSGGLWREKMPRLDGVCFED